MTEIIETHMSRVTLEPTRVYKALKPVRFAFADFSTAAKRKAACEAELVHNRAWAPGVYLGVVRFGEPEDYAVEMVRLPDERRLFERVEQLSPEDLEAIGQTIRAVHDTLPRRPGSAASSVVAERLRCNLAELEEVDLPIAHARLRAALNGALARAEAALKARAGRGQLTHGDLRTEHVYLLDEGVRVLDGVSFNEALAEGDPVEDVAFLAMELVAVHGRPDLAAALKRGWSGDEVVPSALWELYAGHRALIRAKVAALRGDSSGLVRHVVHALYCLEAPRARPALIGVGGLPGVGKSTLAGLLHRFEGFRVLRSDVVRTSAACLQDRSVRYSPEAKDAVYGALFSEAAACLAQGERVLVDASFGCERWREQLIAVGNAVGIPVILLLGFASEATVEARLAARVGDPSEADVAVYRAARLSWEAPSEATRRHIRWVDTGAAMSAVLDEALQALTGFTGGPMDQNALDALRKEVVTAIYGQSQWLEAITVAVPSTESPSEWKGAVQFVLCDLQLDNVDISIAEGAHEAPWIRHLELGPGWS